MVRGIQCGEFLCNYCEHVGGIHQRKLQAVRYVRIQISFAVDHNTYRSGKLNRVLEGVIQNAIELHCPMVDVNCIEVE
jgi:hypothetical protein